MKLHMQTDKDLDARLSELERELEPVLSNMWRTATPRTAFAAELRERTTTDAPASTARMPMSLPHARLSRQRAWGALAAVLVGGIVVGSAAVFYRPQPANAEAILDQLQTEAADTVLVTGGCAPAANGPRATTGGMLVIGAGGPGLAGPDASGGPGKSGPVSISNASDLSDKLATALGVSGDQVRQAMLATMQSLSMEKAPPPDPMAGIATQLGLPEDQVCQAIFNSGSPVGITLGSADGKGNAFFESKGAVAPDGKQALNLTTASTEQLAPIAAKLGVSPQKLQSAINAAVAAATPVQLPTPPSQQQIVSTFARNLGMDEGRVSSAITQVEGSNGFYFAVPMPGATR